LRAVGAALTTVIGTGPKADGMPDRPNVLLVLSDEHRPDALGVAGHDHVETPTLDRLAATGTRFSNAYCPSPLCAPCRASFTTGRYVHEVGAWDNAASYDGSAPSWGERFADAGVPVTTVGKLDFRPGVEAFEEQIEPSYRAEPDVNGLHREPPIVRESARERILAAGPTEEPGWHERQDARCTEAALSWLREHADDEEPWVLSLNYILPHFPLTARREYYERYPEAEMDLPADYPAGDDHPILEELRDHFDGRAVPESVLRRTRAAYYALCTELDDNLARVLDALEETGQREDTLVVYTADHGEPLGDHECWWKCSMYEQSVGVPMVASGPDVEAGRVIDQPVSLLDLVPTFADVLGLEPDPAWRGESLADLLAGGDPDPERAVFSEYHAHGTSRGAFMLRQGRYKYVHYPDNPAQLFDLDADPEELDNLADDPDYADVRARLEAELRAVCDPAAVDRRAREDQAERRECPVTEWW
jgi:choline-sulfatase